MPCIVLTGHPCAGKTTIAERIRERVMNPVLPFSKLISKVVIINEESACPGWSKNQCYETPLVEKKSRAALKSSFDRAVGIVENDSSTGANQSTLIILDSMNYIKGFRYELHCISKAAGVQHCVLWVLNRHETIKRINRIRQEEWKAVKDGAQNDSRPKTGGPYDDDIMDELILRFEPPDERNRWDKPLYTIDCSKMFQETELKDDKDINEGADSIQQSDVLKRSVYNMHSLSEKIGGDSGATTSVKENKSAMRRPKKSAFSSRIKKKSAAEEFKTASSPADSGIGSSIANQQPIASFKESASSKTEGGILPRSPVSIEEQIDALLESFIFHVKPLTQGASTQLHIPGELAS